jgi:DNA transformation protein
MGVSDGFVDFLLDQLSGIGPVSTRRMFSGVGLYADGVMFGLVFDDALYLKTDAESVAEFQAQGLEPFSFVRQGRRVATSFWRASDQLYEEREAMHRSAARAIIAAKRKISRSRRGTPSTRQRQAE